MRKLIVLLTGFALTLNAAPLAQSRPNFSGTWTQVRNPTAPPAARLRGDGAGNPGSAASSESATSSGSASLGNLAFNCSLECTMVQTATALTIRRPTDANGFTPPDVVLKLDGSDSPNTYPGREGRPPTTYAAKAKWNGQALVVTRQIGSSEFLTTQALSLEGGTLRIITGATVPGITPQALTYTKKK